MAVFTPADLIGGDGEKREPVSRAGNLTADNPTGCGCVPTSQTSPTICTHDSTVIGTGPNRSCSQAERCAHGEGAGA
jgi:hypothetical protein